MKKTILSIIAMASFIAFATSCTNDTASIKEINDSSATVSESFHQAAKASFWDDIIGYDRGNGIYEVTADKQAITDYFEDILTREDNATTIKTIQIVQKTATNDSLSTGYMLVGGDNNGTSIALWLTLNTTNHALKLDQQLADKSISCKGCTSGCNIAYLTVEEGKKVAYCNENGCNLDCTKTETSSD